MSIEILEKGLFDTLLEQVEVVERKFDNLNNQVLDRRLGKWMNNEDVCKELHICKRTLQHYRDSGKIPFTRINNIMYYKPGDVEKLLTLKKQQDGRFNF